MDKISLLKTYPDSLAVGISKNYLIDKKCNRVLIYDSKDKLLRSIEDNSFSLSISISPKEDTYFYTLNNLSECFSVFSLPYGNQILTLKKIDGFSFFYKKAVYSEDGSKIYLLADHQQNEKIESCVFQIDLNYQNYQIHLLNQGLNFDGITYIQEKKVFALYSYSGLVSYFREGKIIHTIKIPPFEKLFFIDSGEIIMISTLAGFSLLSKNGKILRRCDFLLPIEVERKKSVIKRVNMINEMRELFYQPTIKMKDSMGQCFVDMELCQEGKRLLYLSYNINTDKYYLHLFSLNSFILKKTILLKGHIRSISVTSSYLIVRTRKGVKLFSLLSTSKKTKDKKRRNS